jgi:hypothetical protein
MAHELSMINGSAQMAYVGKTPWHGLGQSLAADATIPEWLAASGMDTEFNSSASKPRRYHAMKRLFLASALLVTPIAAHATEWQTGNTLMRNCQSSQPAPYGVCLGYIEGIAGVLGLNPVNEFQACIPTGVEAGQLQEVVVRFIARDPTTRHMAATGIVAAAFAAAWPCPKSNT